MSSRWVVHPFLIGMFPTVFLYAHNVSETSPRELIAPIGVVLALTLLLWSVLSWLVKSAHKAGLIVSLFLVLFFSLGHCNAIADQCLTDLSEFWIRKSIHLRPISIVIPESAGLGLLAYLILRKLKTPQRLTAVVNLFSLTLLAIPTASAAIFLSKPHAVAPSSTQAIELPRRDISLPPHPGPSGLPDIYYIILDGYARTDVLREIYGYDNELFLKRLEQLGFYVARRSRSNYCQTPLCLASTLNCRYLDGLAIEPSSVQDALKNLIGDNSVVRALKRHGYQFVSFATGFDHTDHPEADIYLTPQLQLSEFHRMLVSTTPLGSLLSQYTNLDSYQMSRQRTLFALKKLPEVAKLRAPTFTFAHILCPHPPFVFGAHGEDVSPYGRIFKLTDDLMYRDASNRDDYIESYKNQVAFLTGQVERMVGRILANSPEPPIIILQSDHGSGLGLNISSLEHTDIGERMSILNAYYLPHGGHAELYDTISPVNSFRIVLNHYFGANLELFEDKSYFSTWSDPLSFTDVTARLPSDSWRARPLTQASK